MKKIVVFKGEEELVRINLDENPEINRAYSQLEKEFNEKVYELYQEAEEKDRWAEERYGDPVVNF